MRLYEIAEDLAIIEQMIDQEDVDQESFQKALDSLNTEFESKVANIGLLVKQLQADNEARANAIKDLQARSQAASRRVDWLKGYLKAHLDRTVKTPLVTVSKQKGRERVIVDDPAALPPDCLVVRDPEPNKTLILQRLKGGDEVPGARIERGDDFVVIR